MPNIDVAGRHPTIQDLAQWFDFDHLPEPLRGFSEKSCDLATCMIDNLPDSPQLALGLQKLLEAKDCFVRASQASHQEALRQSDELQEVRKAAIRDDSDAVRLAWDEEPDDPIPGV